MREALILALILKKVLLKVITCFRKRMVNMFYLRQHAEIGLDGLKVAVPTLKSEEQFVNCCLNDAKESYCCIELCLL